MIFRKHLINIYIAVLEVWGINIISSSVERFWVLWFAFDYVLVTLRIYLL